MKKLPILSLSAAVFVALLWCGPARAQGQVPPTPQPLPQNIARFAADYVDGASGNATLFYGRNQSVMRGNIESMYLRDRDSETLDESGFRVLPKPVPIGESYAVGDIFYDGVLYPGVAMRLDLHRDQLAVTGPGGISMAGAVVDPDRFGWADLRGYHIIHLPPPAADGDLPGGYYLQLSDGRHRVLMKERFELDSGERNFTIRTVRYYVEKDGMFHRVKISKGSVLRLLRDRRAELNRFVRSRGLMVRRDMERALVEIVGEYERLNYR